MTASLTRFDSSSLMRDVLVARKFDEAAGKIGIAGRQRRLDIFGDQRRAVPQGRIEPQIGQFGRIVLRRQDRKGVARVWP